MKGSRCRKGLVVWLLVGMLSLGMFGGPVLADNPDPVTDLRTYLEGLNAEPDHIDPAVQAIKEALEAGADPVAVREMVQIMAELKASPETTLRISERVRTMAQQRVDLGQIVSELRVVLQKGEGLQLHQEGEQQGEGLEHALQAAQEQVEALDRAQEQVQMQDQSSEDETKQEQETEQHQGREQHQERDEEGSSKEAGGSGGQGRSEN
ncbi:MAG: hypothetical protein ACM3VX_02595 [Bacteroidota bacterium]